MSQPHEPVSQQNVSPQVSPIPQLLSPQPPPQTTSAVTSTSAAPVHTLAETNNQEEQKQLQHKQQLQQEILQTLDAQTAQYAQQTLVTTQTPAVHTQTEKETQTTNVQTKEQTQTTTATTAVEKTESLPTRQQDIMIGGPSFPHSLTLSLCVCAHFCAYKYTQLGFFFLFFSPSVSQTQAKDNVH